jgi:hypothetical protein
MQVLFIGGPADGQWREVEYLQPECAIPVLEPCSATVFGPKDPMTAERFYRTIYYLETLRDATRTYYVYVHGRADGNVIGVLLEGYKP